MMSRLRAGRLVRTWAVLLGSALLPCAVSRGADAQVRETVDADIKAAWAREKITPAKPATDAEFLRRVSLDLVGVVPSYEETVAFLDSKESDKRDKLIDRLLADPRFARHQADVWDMVLFGRNPPGVSSADRREGFQTWLRSRFEKNVPYDEWARELLKAEGHQRGQRRHVLRPVPQRPGGRDRGRRADVPRRATPVRPLPRSPVRGVEAARLLRHGRVPRPARRRHRRPRRGTRPSTRSANGTAATSASPAR